MTRFKLLLSFLVLTFAVTASAQLANAPWPRFHQNNQNTGLALGSGSNGVDRWIFAMGDSIAAGSPVIGADGTIYVSSDFGILFALTPAGTQKWTYNTVPGTLPSTPAIALDGTIIFGAGSQLIALNPDGSAKWTGSLSGAIGSASPAIASDGTIYIGVANGLDIVNANGSLRLQVPLQNASFSSPALASDGTIYLGTLDGLYAFHPDGSVKWSDLVNGMEYSPAVGSDGTIYAGAADGNLRAINPDGSQKWFVEVDTANPVDSSPAIATDGTIYVGSHDMRLYAIDPSGTVKWTYPTNGPVQSSPAVGADGVVYFQSYWAFYAVNSTGDLKWSFAPTELMDSNGASPAIGADGTVYFGTGDGVGYVYALGTTPGNIPISSLTLTPNTVFGGFSSIGTVTLISAAPAGGNVVALFTSSGQFMSIPGAVTVPSGSSSTTFAITTLLVPNNANVTLTAKSGSATVHANLAINPGVFVKSVSFSTSPVVGGSTTVETGTVTITGPAPAGGMVVSLNSQQPLIASVPASVTIPAGATSATFPITHYLTSTNSAVPIKATFGGASQSANLVVTTVQVSMLTISPTVVIGGMRPMATVALNANMRAATVVSIIASSGSVTIPATVTIPAGGGQVSFAVICKPVTVVTNLHLTATVGFSAQPRQMTIIP